MRTLWTHAITLALPFVALAACQPRNDDTTQPNVTPTAGYPPPGQPPPGTPPGYPPGAVPPGYPAATTPLPPGPAPAPTGSVAMAVPGPYAFSCTDDVPCGLHHCNLQYKKCAFPCQTAADCLSPNTCVAGICIPVAPQSR